MGRVSTTRGCALERGGFLALAAVTALRENQARAQSIEAAERKHTRFLTDGFSGIRFSEALSSK